MNPKVRTWSPWYGCAEVDSGCLNCYARHMVAKRLKCWGPGVQRKMGSEAQWDIPEKLNVEQPGTIMVPGLYDPFDEAVSRFWIDSLLRYVERTTHLLWVLLTKRPGRMAEVLASYWRDGAPEHVMVGVSAYDQATLLVMWEQLNEVAVCKRRMIALSPLLGEVELPSSDIDWVVVGGEMGARARPCKVQWIKKIIGQCGCDGIPVYVTHPGWNLWDDAGNRVGWSYNNLTVDLCVREYPAKAIELMNWNAVSKTKSDGLPM